MSKSAPTVTLVTRSALMEIARNALQSSRMFSATNKKVDGTIRKWIIAPKAGKSQIKGTGSSRPTHVNLPAVFDLSSSQARDAKGRFQPVTANGWRTLNLATLIEIKRGGTIYRVQD